MANSITIVIALLLSVFITMKITKAREIGSVNSSCFPLSDVGRSLYEISSHQIFSNNTYGGKCNSVPNCICVGNYEKVAIQCKGGLDADAYTAVKHVNESEDFEQEIRVNCNGSLDFNMTRIDFHKHLRLNSAFPTTVYFVDCPEPIVPYSSILRPREGSTEPKSLRNIPNIQNLEINCTRKMSFRLERIYFLGLQNLKSLRIECEPILELPEDMFEGMTNTEKVTITHTSIEHVPNNIFLKLRNLKDLDLTQNRIRVISKESFAGLYSLNYLYLHNNLISTLDDEAFNQTENISILYLQSNRITSLPNSLDKIRNLRMLNISRNFISVIAVNDCRQIQISETNITQNTSLKCIQKLINSDDIDFSGNRVDYLPKTVVEREILNFCMSHNRGKLKTLSKFLTSKNLTNLEITNSSIENVDSDFLSGFPNLTLVDLSFNSINSLSENLLAKNPKLKMLDFHNNNLTTLPRLLFLNNLELEYVDLSSNSISIIYDEFFSDKKHLKFLNISNNLILELKGGTLVSPVLKVLDLSFNNISKLDASLLRNCCSELVSFDISYNRLETIKKETFWNLTDLENLNISNNRISTIDADIFRDLKSIQSIDFSDNYLYEFPYVKKEIPTPDSLKELNLNGNRLTLIEMHYPRNIERLYLSSNNIVEVTIVKYSKIKRLSISFNPLKGLLLIEPINVNMMELDLSHNNMSFCDTIVFDAYNFLATVVTAKQKTPCPFESINFSHNNIDFDNSPSRIERETMLWGKTTKLRLCDNIKRFDYSYNSIKDVLLDWRVDPILEFVNVQHNEIQFLKEQDILFDNSKNRERTCILYSDDPVRICERNLTIDLRHNNIRGVELSSENLVVVPSSCNRTMNHSHATILLDNNPFYCGFGLFNFLRYVEEDVTLVSEVKRATGENKALPAKILPGNLTCSEPELVKGKKVMEPETYMYQAMPMLGILAFREVYEEDDYEET